MAKFRSHLFNIVFLLFFPVVVSIIRLDDWWHMRQRLGKQSGDVAR
jgi:hypothetical protein